MLLGCRLTLRSTSRNLIVEKSVVLTILKLRSILDLVLFKDVVPDRFQPFSSFPLSCFFLIFLFFIHCLLILFNLKRLQKSMARQQTVISMSVAHLK